MRCSIFRVTAEHLCYIDVNWLSFIWLWSNNCSGSNSSGNVGCVLHNISRLSYLYQLMIWRFGVFIFVVLRVFFNSVVRFYRGSLLWTCLISCFRFILQYAHLWHIPHVRDACGHPGSVRLTTYTLHSLGVWRWFTLIFGFWRQFLHQFVFYAVP